MDNVAILIKHGVNGQKFDKACALEYLQQAANQNLVPAMVQLAILYLESYELNMTSQENLDSALFWLEKASALGDQQALYYLDKAQNYLIEYQLNADNQKDQQLEQFLKETENILINEFQPSVQSHEIKSNLNEDKELNINISENLIKENIVSPLTYEDKTFLKDISKDDLMTASDEKEIIVTENQPLFKTDKVKLIQKNLRQIALNKKERESSQNKTQTLKLSSNALEIAKAIKSGDSKNIKFNNLRNLFKDPAFQNQIEIRNTKSGILVSAHNRTNNQHATASNHLKHTKRFKGTQPAFIKELGYLLKIFPDLF